MADEDDYNIKQSDSLIDFSKSGKSDQYTHFALVGSSSLQRGEAKPFSPFKTSIMGKVESTKVIRVWLLGASICATIFLSVSAYYDFWAMKTYIDYGTNEENTTYFGLWNKCLDQRRGNNATEQLHPMTTYCEKYGDGKLAGMEGTPGFVKVTRGLLMLMLIIMVVASIGVAVTMTISQRPLIYIAAPPLLVGSVAGIIILGVFLGTLGHANHYKDYVPAWTFYFFLNGWFFTISAFASSLTDRSEM